MPMPALSRSTSRPPFLAVAADEATRAVMLRVAGEYGWPEDRVLEGSAIAATDALAHIETPETLLVDLSGSADPVADIDSLSRVCMADTRVIVLGDVNDIRLYRHLIEIGVEDYLLKPVSADDLKAAIERLDETPAAAPEEAAELGRLVAVTGVRGGAGATTVAVNLAWMAAHERGLRVALVDLDLYFGTIALALDVEPGLGFREALENPSRIDGLFIERAMVRESENLYILAAEEGLDNSFSFDPKSLDRLLETLRAGFDCVILDLPRFAARSQVSTLTGPASVVLVSDPTLAGMRDAMRLSKLVKKVAGQSELSIVVNRVGNSKSGELAIGDFESGAELGVDIQIPYDCKTSVLAEGAGKTAAYVGRKTRMVRSLRQLGGRVFGDGEENEKMALWQRLSRRG